MFMGREYEEWLAVTWRVWFPRTGVLSVGQHMEADEQRTQIGESLFAGIWVLGPLVLGMINSGPLS